jgi:hypothetical protein
MNVEIGTEAAHFFFQEYLFRVFDIVSLQCINSLTGIGSPNNILFKANKIKSLLSINAKMFFLIFSLPWRKINKVSSCFFEKTY